MSKDTGKPVSKNWWGAAWLEKMERLAEPGRFREGAHYALANLVQQVRFDGRSVTGVAQGSGEPGYTVRITFEPFSRQQWDQLFAQVRNQRVLASALESGDLPLEMQTAFSKARLLFMPERYVDLHLDCACPDWFKPCRHIVAVWLKFARDFDRDPLLVFHLRGMKRDELFHLLRGRDTDVAEPEPAAEEVPAEEVFLLRPESLPADPEAFWAEPVLPALSAESAERRLLDDDLLEKSGPAPFVRNWRSLETQFHQVYDSVYDLAAQVLRRRNEAD